MQEQGRAVVCEVCTFPLGAAPAGASGVYHLIVVILNGLADSCVVLHHQCILLL